MPDPILTITPGVSTAYRLGVVDGLQFFVLAECETEAEVKAARQAACWASVRLGELLSNPKQARA